MVSYGDAVLQGISDDDSFWQCGSDSTCDGRSCKWTKEKKFIRKIVHEILAAAILCFLISFTIRKGWIFQGALIAGNGLLETIGRNMRTFEPDYALTISEPLQPFVTAVFM